jgi:serine/threonine protein kinase
MLYCSNPTCSNPFIPDGNTFCLSCGSQTLSPLFRNRYRVIQLLGEGGFGRTYEAIDTDRMDDPGVIKQFFPQVQGTAALEKATELFKQEAKRLYELGEHPQIPRLIAYFEQDKRLYLVQELIKGQTLLAELQQQGTFSEEKIWQLLADLLPVLKVVHERGVIHRDIKPENIMRRRKDGKLMLIDFGVSKQVTATLLGQAGTTVGTHGYAPMEQMRGQVYPASDLYSLGVTCIRLMTQCLPQEEGSDALYDAINGKWIWRERLPEGTNISPQLADVLDKMLQNYLKNRYQSADEVLADVGNESQTIPDSSRNPLNISLIGTWSGKSIENQHTLVTLVITHQQSDNFFEGSLNVRNLHIKWTYRIDIDVKFNPKTNAVKLRENHVISEHSWWTWRLSENVGTLSADGKEISGERTDPKNSDSWVLVRVDYGKLTELLVAGYWKEADEETGKLMLKISCREHEGWLNSEDIREFPYQDLCKINELWEKYSNGRFGFSVQRRIWKTENCDWIKVGKRVGWRMNNKWKNYSNLTFTLNAPEGAFPTFWGGEGRNLLFGYSGCWEDFFARIKACGL